MSYVVLARKYRPLRFADLVGQDHVTRTLGNAIEQDRVHHAYLFSGARGLGKTTTARILAKALVCEKGPTATPCNECEQCVAVNESRSVDVVEIDGASNNSVDNIRNLREQVHYLPQTARRKIYIIDEVHMLTTSAFNALLKTLEEPPDHVNFVFATTEPQKVLPTILSRVSRLDFRRLSQAQIIDHLRNILTREELGIDDGGLAILARASGGSVRDSLTLTDQVIAFSENPKQITEAEARGVLGQAEHGAIAELIDAVLDRDPTRTLATFDALVTAGHDLMVLSLQVLEHLRDLAIVRVCNPATVMPDATSGELETLTAQANKAEPMVLAQLFDRFSRIIDRLPTSRVQRLLIEMGLIELAQTEAMVPLGDVIQRLESIAGGDAGPGTSGAAPGGSGTPGPGRGRGQRASASPASASPAPASPASASPAPASSAPQQSTAVAAPAEPHPTARPSAFAAPVPSEPAPPEPPPKPPTPVVSPDSSPLTKDLWAMAQGAVRHGDSSAASAPPHSPPKVASQKPADPPIQVAPRSRPPTEGTIPWAELEPFAAWEQLVARIRDQDEFLSAVLSELGLVGLADGTLSVAAPKGTFAYTQLSTQADVRSRVEQAMRDHLGQPFSIELSTGEPILPGLPSIVLVEQRRREAHQAALDTEARDHTGIRSLVATFNGELRTTKPLSEP